MAGHVCEKPGAPAKNRRKIWLLFIGIGSLLLAAALFYNAVSVQIGIQIERIVDASYARYGQYDSQFSGIISEDLFRRVNNRDHGNKHETYTENVVETHKRTSPQIWHNFLTATALYQYSYEYRGNLNGEEGSSGAQDIPVWVHLALQNGNWVVTNVYEEP